MNYSFTITKSLYCTVVSKCPLSAMRNAIPFNPRDETWKYFFLLSLQTSNRVAIWRNLKLQAKPDQRLALDMSTRRFPSVSPCLIDERGLRQQGESGAGPCFDWSGLAVHCLITVMRLRTDSWAAATGLQQIYGPNTSTSLLHLLCMSLHRLHKNTALEP